MTDEILNQHEWVDSRGHRHLTTQYRPKRGYLGDPRYVLVQTSDIDLDLAERVVLPQADGDRPEEED
jgi:hypothetical protein